MIPPPSQGKKVCSASAWLLAGYALFVVYGSLVPLQFKALAAGEAWDAFQRIPFLQLGLDARADWVANGVLYVPLAFLAARLAFERGLAQALAVPLAIATCTALAVAIEFTQLFFPPRTVSLNDLLAEALGSVLGACASLLLARWVDRLGQAWRVGGARLAPWLLQAYAAAYVLLCGFPYDLLLSADEVQGKWRSSAWGVWLAAHDRGLAQALLQLAVEVALCVPIGWMLGRRTPRGRVGPLQALAWGAGLGLLIEVGQFFVSSGVSQGASVISRALGVMAGAALAPRLLAARPDALRTQLGRWAALLWLGYLPLLAFANGAFRQGWQGADAALQSAAAVHLLPFYYHYYTTEAIALFSLGSVALMYAPAAALAWTRRWPAAGTLALVAVLAVAMECGKLFVAGLRPDPTNVLIALASAAATRWLLDLGLRAPRTGVPQAELPASGVRTTPTPRRKAGSAWLLALPAAAAWVLFFPVAPWALLAGLALCAAAVWQRPWLALAVLPAALPVLDLAPWSGRLYLDEFDALTAVCLGVALHRTPRLPGAARMRGAAATVWLLLACSLAASTLRGAWPLPWPDDNSFIGYYSPYNALRIAKGAVAAALFVLLWRRLQARGAAVVGAFGTGMAGGLALCVAVVLWERVVFASLWDFAAEIRVTGPFSAMHKGGAYIECYLAVGAAFVLAGLLRARTWALRVAGLLLLALAGYATLVTYSRNGHAALAAVLLLGLATALPWRTLAGQRRALAALQAGLAVAVVAVVAVPVLGGSYARSRLAQTGSDLAVRSAHWADGLALRDGSLATALIGMGIGRYPQAHFWRSSEPLHAASMQLARRDGQRFLRLGQGATVYVEQVIAEPPVGALRLVVELRSTGAATSLPVMLCEKWTLTSRQCAQVTVPAAPAPAGTAWNRVELPLDATAVLSRRAAFGAPLKLSLLTPPQGVVEIGRVELATSAGGESLLANGMFQQGLDRWFFATDVDPPWHLHSLPVAVLFDQGWLGVLAWTAVLLLALVRGALLAWRDQALVPAALPALAGFLVSGSLNTLIDAPRFLWLLLVLAWACTAARSAAPLAAARPAAPGPSL